MVDMSPAAITARLRQVSEAADLRPERRLDQKIDMSSAAVTRRLRRVSELRRLCIELGKLRERSS
jgi:hypothetical protein